MVLGKAHIHTQNTTGPSPQTTAEISTKCVTELNVHAKIIRQRWGNFMTLDLAMIS